MSEVTTEPTGVIHDIGYQRYAGPRLGRRHLFGALYVHGLRAAFGLGRSAKAKIFPWFVIGVVTLVAVVAPELISRDLGTGVLPLYFSRPLRRSDYALARLAAVVTAVFLLLGGPQLVMFAGNAFGEDKMSGVWDEFTSLLPGLAYAAMWALVYGSIAALIASLTGKRAFGAGGIVAVFLVSAPVVGVLSVVGAAEVAGLASPTTIVRGTGEWLFLKELEPRDGGQGLGIGDFGPLYGAVAVVLVTTCVLLLLARYRRVAR